MVTLLLSGMLTITLALTIYALFDHCKGDAITAKTQPSMEEMIRATCLDKSGFRPLDANNTFFRVVEAVEGANVSLPCSYCGESTEDEPRIWRWRPRVENSSEQEVNLGLGPDLEANRLLTYPNHTLVVHNASLGDAGLYVCGGLPEEDATEFRFSLDLVQPNVSVLEAKRTSWAKYEKEVILMANERIYEVREPEIDALLDKVKVRVVAEWEPWLPCDGCASLRRRYAKCRVRSVLNLAKHPELTLDTLKGTHALLHQAEVSCHSLLLALWFPAIYNVTSTVPNLQQEQTCFDSCLMDTRLAHEARYYTELKMEIGSSLAFVCPGVDLKSKVTWKKDGVTMKPVGFKIAKKSSKLSYYKKFFKRPQVRIERAFVDRMHTLQLCLVGPDESAVYTCYSDKLPVKSFNVTVVTAEETLRQRRYHFWLLSCYTSLLSTVVVGVGILWAFLRRHEFLRVVEEEDLDSDGDYGAGERDRLLLKTK